jgi:hypothetical protein
MEQQSVITSEPTVEEIFPKVEEYLRNYIRLVSISKGIENMEGINVCCNDEERAFLQDMAKHLKRAVPQVSIKDICIAIIYSYYLLNLIDNTDFLKHRSYNSGYADNAEHVKGLVNGITYQDIMLDGKNLSSTIRRYMFGMFDMKQHGAKGRRSKSYKKNKKDKGINYKKSKRRNIKSRRIRNKNKK